MFGRTVIKRESTKTKIAKSYTGEDIVEKHHRPRPEDTRHIEDERACVNGWRKSH